MEDLIQEGKTLVVKLRKSQGSDVPLGYLVAAISYHFSNLMRATVKRNRLSLISLDSIYDVTEKIANGRNDLLPRMIGHHFGTAVPDPRAPDKIQEIDDEVDRENFMKTISNPKLARVLRYLINGEKPRWIAKRQKTSVRQVYRQLTALRKLRKEWEKDE
jgi:hypothetical protein